MTQSNGLPTVPKAPIGERDRGTEGRGRTALVTGASSGIGFAMSELLAAKGFDVVLVARREQRLTVIADELKRRWKVDASPLVADLAVASAPADIAAALASSGQRIDFLVNNAGFAQFGRYDQLSWGEHGARLRVMGIATLELTHRLLPPMVERGWGRIVNVGSIAGLFNGTPQDSIYGASKAMVRCFSESIDAEFRPHGVRCTVSVPGFTATEILDQSGLSDRVAKNPLFAAAMMSPATVARQAYRAVMAGRPMVIHGAHHRLLAAALLHAPLRVRRFLANALASGNKPPAN